MEDGEWRMEGWDSAESGRRRGETAEVTADWGRTAKRNPISEWQGFSKEIVAEHGEGHFGAAVANHFPVAVEDESAGVE